jgi:hypothetical protein
MAPDIRGASSLGDRVSSTGRLPAEPGVDMTGGPSITEHLPAEAGPHPHP